MNVYSHHNPSGALAGTAADPKTKRKEWQEKGIFGRASGLKISDRVDDCEMDNHEHIEADTRVDEKLIE